MDELDLMQEAVSNWESLQEVAEVETCEVYRGAEGKRAYLSRILLRDREAPIYIEMRAVTGAGGALVEMFNNGKPVAWSRPGYSLN